MKSGNRFFLFSLLSCLALTPALQADAVADLQAPFTMALKLTANTPPIGRSVADGSAYETSAKFFAVTFTQRDILVSLIEEGKIAPPLSGWSVVARVRSDEAPVLGHRLFAVKKGQPDFALDDEEEDTLTFEPGFLINAFKERYHSSGGYYTGSGTGRFHVAGFLNADGEAMYLGGLATYSYAFKEATLDSATVTIPVPSAISLKLTGGAVFVDEELGEFSAIIEGSMGFGAHKITAVRTADSEP